MDIVCIEKKTFEAMMARFEAFARRAESIIRRNSLKRANKWLDSQDVCLILHITPRTLHTLRSTGKLPYSQVEGKIWYRRQDVDRLLEKSINNSKSKHNR